MNKYSKTKKTTLKKVTQDFKKYEKSRNLTVSKDHNNFLVTDSKDMEIYNFPEKRIERGLCKKSR